MWKEIIDWFISLFKKPSHVIAPKEIVGSSDYVTPNINNVSQNWLIYLSQPYRSQFQGFDEDNCATRAAIECLEAILNYYLKNNLLPEFSSTFLKQYCNKEGYVKLSIRYNATLNNTTTSGASVDTVWNNFAIYGFVPESVYPDPKSPFSWNDYYRPVPDNIISFGKNSAKVFKVVWQVIWNNNWSVPNPQTLREALIGSPVYFASNIGVKNDQGIEQPSDRQIYQHARVLYGIDNYLEVLNSYEYPSYLNKLSLSCPLACCIKVSLKLI